MASHASLNKKHGATLKKSLLPVPPPLEDTILTSKSLEVVPRV